MPLPARPGAQPGPVSPAASLARSSSVDGSDAEPARPGRPSSFIQKVVLPAEESGDDVPEDGPQACVIAYGLLRWGGVWGVVVVFFYGFFNDFF